MYSTTVTQPLKDLRNAGLLSWNSCVFVVPSLGPHLHDMLEIAVTQAAQPDAIVPLHPLPTQPFPVHVPTPSMAYRGRLAVYQSKP